MSCRALNALWSRLQQRHMHSALAPDIATLLQWLQPIWHTSSVGSKQLPTVGSSRYTAAAGMHSVAPAGSSSSITTCKQAYVPALHQEQQQLSAAGCQTMTSKVKVDSNKHSGVSVVAN